MYPINEKALTLLTKVRQKLETAWSPEGEEPGEGSASNSSDAEDVLDLYLDAIVERLLEEFEISEDDAYDFVFACADELAEEEDLPEMPDDAASDQDVAVWVGQAKTLGFVGYVLGRARSGDE
jgi:hypothetical protein